MTFDKIKWILGIALVFFLVITTNLVDRKNFSIVRDSVETIYADRIVAQDLLFEMSAALCDKQLAYFERVGEDFIGRQANLDARLDDNISAFAATKLTPREEGIFRLFREELAALQSVRVDEEKVELSQEVAQHFDDLKDYLAELSAIQTTEGRRELLESKRAIGSADLFTQLEIGALVLMAIIVQIIILYRPKTSSDE